MLVNLRNSLFDISKNLLDFGGRPIHEIGTTHWCSAPAFENQTRNNGAGAQFGLGYVRGTNQQTVWKVSNLDWLNAKSRRERDRGTGDRG